MIQRLIASSLLIFSFAATAFAGRFTAPPTLRLRPHARLIVIHDSARVDAPFSSLIVEAARAHGVDPQLLVEVARRESHFNPNAVSPVGACGLMQLMPATARLLGISNIFDVRENVFGGARYLRQLLDAYHGDLDLTLAAYNAGPGAVQKYNGVPPFPETRAYVTSIRRALRD
jgi:soluble lytic murein transglycosylase-like protein